MKLPDLGKDLHANDSSSTAQESTRPGLRERKRRALSDTIQREAITLFSELGYRAVTIEQIAEAANISRSTFFRYFATKEAVVLYDSLDPAMIEIFRSQPSTISTIQALRNTLRAVPLGAHLDNSEKKLHKQRRLLIHSVPEVRAAALDEVTKNTDMLAELIAERLGRAENDTAIRTLSSALVGVAIGIIFDQGNDDNDYLERFDVALEQLEAGFRI